LRIHFWGARGSTPAPGPSTLRYGGNTPCVEIRAGDQLFILDAGTGLRDLGRQLRAELGGDPLAANLLLTHYHWDHIEGLPSFEPLFLASTNLRLFGPVPQGEAVRDLIDVLRILFDSPFSPLQPESARAAVTPTHLTPGENFVLGETRIRTCALNHPQGALAYRLEHNGVVIVYATDHEPGRVDLDRALCNLARDAHLFISDAQFTPEELAAPGNAGLARGHGSWDASARLAREAGVKNLVLFHHHPARADEEIDRLLAATRQVFPATCAAAEGMVIDAEPDYVHVWARHGRRGQRVPLPLAVQVEATREGSPLRHPAHLKDIGFQGAYFLSPESYQREEPLSLEISWPAEGASLGRQEEHAPVRLRGTVARIDPKASNGGWIGVGVTFTESFSIDALPLPGGRNGHGETDAD